VASDNHIHIISFNIPYPADYGGVIDVYYKIKALAAQGMKIHLHAYEYGRGPAKRLEEICYEVHYYKRKIYKDPYFSKLPYIVATRNSSDLLYNLLKDDYPILFEGIHCCYYLAHPALKDRFKIVRMHNIEHVYYKNLAKIEKNPFKKYFFAVEAERLKVFEKNLAVANRVAAISPDDAKLLSLKYDNVFYLPVFHANENVNPAPGMGKFALYHANLGVGENNEAALYLVNEVFNDLDYPLVLAGNNASRELKKAIEGKSNIELKNKVSTAEIDELIRNAQLNILPTFQNTGMKLKLINVLFKGRHCIVNDKMIHNTGLEDLCIRANTANKMKQAINKYKTIPFTAEGAEERKENLYSQFNNAGNAEILIGQLLLAKLV